MTCGDAVVAIAVTTATRISGKCTPSPLNTPWKVGHEPATIAARDETDEHDTATRDEKIADETGPIPRDDGHDDHEHRVDRCRDEDATEQRLRPVRQVVQEPRRALADPASGRCIACCRQR